MLFHQVLRAQREKVVRRIHRWDAVFCAKSDIHRQKTFVLLWDWMLRCLRDFDLSFSIPLETRSPPWHCFMYACNQAFWILSIPNFWVIDLFSVTLVFLLFLVQLSSGVFCLLFIILMEAELAPLVFLVKHRQCIYKTCMENVQWCKDNQSFDLPSSSCSGKAFHLYFWSCVTAAGREQSLPWCEVVKELPDQQSMNFCSGETCN